MALAAETSPPSKEGRYSFFSAAFLLLLVLYYSFRQISNTLFGTGAYSMSSIHRSDLVRAPQHLLYRRQRGARHPMFKCPRRQIFGAGGALIQKKNKEKEKGKGKEERREKRKKERGEFNLEDPMFLLISILSSKKL